MLTLKKFMIAVWLLSSFSVHATVILQYHHISDQRPVSTSLSPSLFREHLKHLSDLQYTVLSLPELIAQLKAGKTLPDRSVVITFDDAYSSVYRQAYPLLKEKGWPFTIFVATEALQQEIPGFANWQQLQEMAQYGATIANHSHTHTHFLRRLKEENEIAWRKRIRDDILQAQSIIEEKTGHNDRLLAYPYGEYDLAVKAIVHELDFTAFGQQSGPVPKTKDHPLFDFSALPRFPLGGNYGGIEDFTVKVATLTMPLESVALTDSQNRLLTDTLLPETVERPTLTLIPQHNALGAVQCFASGQGAIKVEQNDKLIQARAKRSLPIGRSRYNCTAASNERGRFYWYSEFFIRKQVDGDWYPEP